MLTRYYKDPEKKTILTSDLFVYYKDPEKKTILTSDLFV